MVISDFKDFKDLYEGIGAPYTNKKNECSWCSIIISTVCHMQVRKKIVSIKTLQNRTTRLASYPPCVQYTRIRDCPRPISNKKYDYLQKLLTWVPKRFH
nr:unnamed protein product [Callosobruchus analis]